MSKKEENAFYTMGTKVIEEINEKRGQYAIMEPRIIELDYKALGLESKEDVYEIL